VVPCALLGVALLAGSSRGAVKLPDLRVSLGSGVVTAIDPWTIQDGTGTASGKTVTTARMTVRPSVVAAGGAIHIVYDLQSVVTTTTGFSVAVGCPDVGSSADHAGAIVSWPVHLYRPGHPEDLLAQAVYVYGPGSEKLVSKTVSCHPFRGLSSYSADLRAKAPVTAGCYALEPIWAVSTGFLPYIWLNPGNTGTLAAISVGGASCGTAGGGAGPVGGSPVAGTVTVQAPGSSPQPLQAGEQIAPGSLVDATAGAVRLRAAAKDAVFSRGAFRLGPNAAVTELALVGGDFSVCRKRSTSGRVVAAKKPIRRLWGKGKGRFRTRGRFAAATVRGTSWQIEDGCEGTTVRVTSGIVEVTSLKTGKTTLVKAGGSISIPA
jgi:hypothetical protein